MAKIRKMYSIAVVSLVICAGIITILKRRYWNNG